MRNAAPRNLSTVNMHSDRWAMITKPLIFYAQHHHILYQSNRYEITSARFYVCTSLFPLQKNFFLSSSNHSSIDCVRLETIHFLTVNGGKHLKKDCC